MRLTVRVLVILAIPMLAFGWLSSVQLVAPPTVDALASTGMFALAGALLAVAGCAVIIGRALLMRRSVPLPALTVTVLLGLTLDIERIRRDQYNDALDIWPEVLLVWGGYVGAALLVIVGVRSLAGLWSMPGLPMLPSRRTLTGLVLVSALVAATEADQPVYWF